jgi:hypothetical protein
MCFCPLLVTKLDVIFRMLERSNFQLVVDYIININLQTGFPLKIVNVRSDRPILETCSSDHVSDPLTPWRRALKWLVLAELVQRYKISHLSEP